MSWKGLKKAVARLPQRIKGTTSDFLDADTTFLVAEFERHDAQLTRLRDDSVAFRQALQKFLNTQRAYLIQYNLLNEDPTKLSRGATVTNPSSSIDIGGGEKLQQSNSLISNDLKNASVGGGGGGKNFQKAQSGYNHNNVNTNNCVMKLTQELSDTVLRLQDDLRLLDRYITQPVTSVLESLRNVRKWITKLEHKGVDLQRFSADAEQPQVDENKDRAVKEVLARSKSDYDSVHGRVITDLPQVIDVCNKIGRPCFLTFICVQTRVFGALYKIYSDACNSACLPIETTPSSISPASTITKQFESRSSEIEDLYARLSSLTLANSTITKPSNSLSSSGNSIPTLTNAPPPPSYEITPGKTLSSSQGLNQANTPMPAPKHIEPYKSMTMVAPNPPPEASAPIKYVIGLYNFQAQQTEDLGFMQGDKIKVTRFNNDRESWWQGEINGRKGIFPANYTKDL